MIADIHCHISTKPMFLKKQDKNCSEQLEFHIIGCLDEIIGGDIVDSQSCINQQLAGAVSFSINPLYALEQNLGNSKNVQLLARNRKVDGDVINDLADGSELYHAHLLKENDLMDDEEQNAASDHINLITPTNKKLIVGKLNILRSIEGTHSLFATTNEYGGTFNNAFFDHVKTQLQTLFPAYLTISHMHQNNIFSFCNGIKMSKSDQEQWFLPHDRGFKGLNNIGRRLLRLCNDNDVAIDLKHTSFANRLAIYEFISDNNMEAPIASHCGVAYMTFTDYLVNNKINIKSRRMWPDPLTPPPGDITTWPRSVEIELNRSKGPLNLYGNPSQINLFDEDIIAILSMGGLIGISLDQRILGGTALKNAKRTQIDQISPEDGNFIITDYNRICQKLNINVPPLDPMQIGLQNMLEIRGLLQDLFEIQRDVEKHFKYFIQTVLYILKIGYDNGVPTPWKHVSMGSDFDGLINAVNFCKTAKKYPTLKNKMTTYCLENEHKSSVLKKVKADGIDMFDLVDHVTFFNSVRFFADRMGLDAQDFIDNTVGVG